MPESPQPLPGPDLAQGIPYSSLSDGRPLLGHAGGEPVVVVRQGAELFAIGAVCTHYSGPLSEGLVVGDTIRCPWHHGCFSLRTGVPVRPPPLNPVACWVVERKGDTVRVTGKRFSIIVSTRDQTCGSHSIAVWPLNKRRLYQGYV